MLKGVFIYLFIDVANQERGAIFRTDGRVKQLSNSIQELHLGGHQRRGEDRDLARC